MAGNGSNSNQKRRTTPRSGCVSEPVLRISATLFSDEAVRHLIDEWIAPALVEEFLRAKNILTDSTERNHTGDQP
jgi:hypothetical protein